jgi:hypothetical protein
MDMSYKNASAAPSLESPPNLSATKIESLCDSYVIVRDTKQGTTEWKIYPFKV